MAGTVTTDQTEIHDCDALSDWTNTPTLDLEVYIEGTGSLSKKISKTTSDHMKTITSADLSDTIIYAWILGGSIAQFNTKALGGIGISVSDGVNTDTWYIAGSDTGYEGGWQCLAVRTTTTPDVDNSANLAAITSVGVHFDITASAAKINCWWDRMAFGTSLTIYAGTSGSPATFDDIVSAEETNKYGIVTTVEGILMCQGKINFGSTTAGVDTYFKDTSEVIVFRDRAFGTDFYDIKLQGNATATVQEIYFGTKSGTRGISGCMFRAAGATKYTVTATDINVLKMGFYGCTFFDASTVSLPNSSTDKDVIDCTFEKCGEVKVLICNVTYSSFIDADDNGIEVIANTFNVTYCNFINCPDGVEITTGATYGFNNMQFSGCTYDIENSGNSANVIINATDSNPSTYQNTGTPPGTTVINNAVTLKVTVKDSSGTGIVGARVLLEADAGGTAPHEESVIIVSTGTTATVTHSAHGLGTGQMVIIRSANEQYYNGVFTITYIGVDSYSYTMLGDPADTATGTITATQAFMSELTIAGGIAEESFAAGATQPYTGVARKSTGIPYYRDSSFSGTDCSGGIDIPVQMELDE